MFLQSIHHLVNIQLLLLLLVIVISHSVQLLCQLGDELGWFVLDLIESFDCFAQVVGRVENAFLESEHDVVVDLVKSPWVVKVVTIKIMKSVAVVACCSENIRYISQTLDYVFIWESVFNSIFVSLCGSSSWIICSQTTMSRISCLLLHFLSPIIILEPQVLKLIHKILKL